MHIKEIVAVQRWPAQVSGDSGSSYRTDMGAAVAEQLGEADVERSARSLNSLQPVRIRLLCAHALRGHVAT